MTEQTSTPAKGTAPEPAQSGPQTKKYLLKPGKKHTVKLPQATDDGQTVQVFVGKEDVAQFFDLTAAQARAWADKFILAE